MPDGNLVEPTNVVAGWDSLNPGIPLTMCVHNGVTQLDPMVVILKGKRDEAKGVLLGVECINLALHILASTWVVILLLYRELIPDDLG